MPASFVRWFGILSRALARPLSGASAPLHFPPFHLLSSCSQYMLNICWIYAEYMPNICSTRHHHNKTIRIPWENTTLRALLTLHALAPLNHHAHLVPHIIAQPPLNRLVVLPCFPQSLVILRLPCRPALRIMENLLACCNQRYELLHMRQTCFRRYIYFCQIFTIRNI